MEEPLALPCTPPTVSAQSVPWGRPSSTNVVRPAPERSSGSVWPEATVTEADAFAYPSREKVWVPTERVRVAGEPLNGTGAPSTSSVPPPTAGKVTSTCPTRVWLYRTPRLPGPDRSWAERGEAGP